MSTSGAETNVAEIRKLAKVAFLADMEALTRRVEEAQLEVFEKEQAELGRIYEEHMLQYLAVKDPAILEACPVVRNAVTGMFAKLAHEHAAGKSSQDGDRQSSGASKVTIIDADGESFIVVDKAGISARISNSMAFRRACAPQRVSSLLLREGTEVDASHILAELISWSQSCLHAATKERDWESTLQWTTIAKLRIFERESFLAFLLFKPLPQSYSTYSLDHFIEGGVRGKDSVALQTALRGFEAVLEFVFGDAFSTVCEPTIRSLSRGSLRAMDVDFLRYSIEMAVRGWCRWIRSSTTIMPSPTSGVVGRQEVCVSKLVECLARMPVKTEDLEAFRASGYASLGHPEKSDAKKRSLGDQQRAVEVSTTTQKKVKCSTDGGSSPGSKIGEQKPVCLFHLTFLLKKDGESARACRFSPCKNSHPHDIQGLCRGTVINRINGSTLTVAAKKALIDRVKERVEAK